jgi:flagellar basal body rod protein FlgB
MKKYLIIVFLGLGIGHVSAQSMTPDQYVERILFDETSYKMEEAIKDTGKRQAVYAFNVANAATPGFKPILFDDDKGFLQQLLPQNPEYRATLIVEHMMARMTANSKRQAAYFALYKKKFDNLKQAITLGKR